MAHKTRSKEQYQSKFYRFKIAFNTNFKNEITPNIDLNAALLFVLLHKQNFPSFETNVFFLKSLQLSIPVIDSRFFNYYYFYQLNQH
jgi:hypothetical protein